MSQSIKEEYLNYLLNHGKRPPSVHRFMGDLGRKESEFYQEYNSFAALEAKVFRGYLDEVLESLEADPTYGEYDSRQKLAAIYFTWFEKLKQQRSIVMIMDANDRGSWKGPVYVAGAEESFRDKVRQVFDEGMDKGEIADRWFVNQWYPNILWGQASYLLQTWIHDQSKGFTRTDASIEKVVRFTFDLIQPNLIDSGWDLLQFLFRQK